MTPKVELRPAYRFICPSCQTENFLHAMVREFDKDADTELRNEQGVQPWHQGHWQLYPREVTCNHCRGVFATKP